MRGSALLAAVSLAVFVSVGHVHAREAGSPEPEIASHGQLLDSVRDAQREQQARDAEREQRFLREKQRQQGMLAEAREAFERSQRENQPLLAVTEENALEIQRLRARLQDEVRDMGDLASTFREFAGDFAAVLEDSMLSAQLPQRRQVLRGLTAPDAFPGIEDVQALWVLLQEDMTEAARIALFDATVVRSDGTSAPRRVMRVGPFSAFSEGDFLRFVPETGELLVLARQPAARYRKAAQSFAAEPGKLAPITVDPSRGNLLGMLSYTPGPRERIEQGGMIGAIIIGLGLLGLLVAVWRGLYLGMVYVRVRGQMQHPETPSGSNPLGRVLLSVADVDPADDELLQLKLDEAVLAEIPSLERGNGLIKLLAATSPLLGLLGTVTGMILTFQAISLFGTGDPKLMAGGISQALVTTVLGLVVAIPLLFSHSVIAYLSRTLIQRLDEQCAGVLARRAEQMEAR